MAQTIRRQLSVVHPKAGRNDTNNNNPDDTRRLSIAHEPVVGDETNDERGYEWQAAGEVRKTTISAAHNG